MLCISGLVLLASGDSAFPPDTSWLCISIPNSDSSSLFPLTKWSSSPAGPAHGRTSGRPDPGLDCHVTWAMRRLPRVTVVDLPTL